MAVHQVRAAGEDSTPHTLAGATLPEPPLEPEELTILMSCAEALACAPDQVSRTLTEARSGATWRAALGIEELSPRLGDVIDALRRVVDAEVPGHDARTFDGVFASLPPDRPGADELETLARLVLRSALEQRRTRQLKLGLRLASNPAGPGVQP